MHFLLGEWLRTAAEHYNLGFLHDFIERTVESIALKQNAEAIATVFILDKRYIYISKTDSGVVSRLSC